MRRARGSRWAFAGSLSLAGPTLALLALAGCSVDPFCFTCPQGTGQDGGDGGGATGEGGRDGGTGEGGDTDACVPTGAEVCDGKDNNCNGMTDEGNPGGGAACGVERGECHMGTFACMDGSLVCTGAHVAMAETCDGLDNDCNGMVDEGNPGGGGPCGTDEGECHRGTARCDVTAGSPTVGTVVCDGQVGPVAEQCNARDDDCNGMVDDVAPGVDGVGEPCGMDVGACAPGTTACVAGAIVCHGATLPRIETCNGMDDDCNGTTDEGFDLMTDPRNCSRCGNACMFDNAVPICMAGTCAIRFCRSGWVDLDGDPRNGCEYMCERTGAESCNGRDDDCDGMTDEGLTPPTGLCNPQGECAGTTPTCRGALGYGCMYGPTVSKDPVTGNIVPETVCDGRDNDCNGRVDDNPAFANVGQVCGNGVGACRRTGMFVCTADGAGTMCNAPAAGAAGSETCNGLDDDCDGVTDETRGSPGTNASFVVEDMVAFDTDTGSGTTLRYMYRYEASRPDATATAQGASTVRSCSRGGVLPWTNVTYPQAVAGCAAAGMRLCTELEWMYACRGAAGDGSAADSLYCEWAVASATECNGDLTTPSTPPPAGRCNTAELDYCPTSAEPRCAALCDDPAFRLPAETPAACRSRLDAQRQHGLLPTGSLPMCYQSWSGEHIFDLTGNAREWAQARMAGQDPIRGGSYDSVYFGATCQIDFTLANDMFTFPNLGFRCCSDSAP